MYTPRLPRISEEQRDGVKKLLFWAVKMYTHTPTTEWFDIKEFLAELQRKQSYTEEDKERYNSIREKYYQHKLG
jgi:hypothetical protein